MSSIKGNSHIESGIEGNPHTGTIKGSTNTMTSDDSIVSLLKKAIEELDSLNRKLPMDAHILVVMPNSKWDEIEPELDTQHVIHSPLPARVAGAVCVAAFVDSKSAVPNTQYGGRGTPIYDLTPVHTSLYCGLSILSSYGATFDKPIGMLVLV